MSTHLRVVGGEDGSIMSWPNPRDPDEIEWRLRYGKPDRSTLLAAASYIFAYKQLFATPQRLRNQRIEEVKRAMLADDPAEDGER